MSSKKLKKIPYKFIIFYNFPYIGGNGMAILDTALLAVRECEKKFKQSVLFFLV